jgi:hypothetical protein
MYSCSDVCMCVFRRGGRGEGGEGGDRERDRDGERQRDVVVRKRRVDALRVGRANVCACGFLPYLAVGGLDIEAQVADMPLAAVVLVVVLRVLLRDCACVSVRASALCVSEAKSEHGQRRAKPKRDASEFD